LRDAFGFGISTVKLHSGETPPAFHDLNAVIDTILFLAGALTYIATAAFAVSLGQAGWIRRGAAHTFTIINLVALVLLVIRGLHFPDPKALSTPWYTSPGFIVRDPGRPPFIIPFLFALIISRLRCMLTSTVRQVRGSLLIPEPDHCGVTDKLRMPVPNFE